MQEEQIGVRPEFPLRNQIVEHLFQPHTEVDQAGFKRRVYYYNDITFSFRGREELPVTPTMQESDTRFLGSIPNYIDREDFERYKQTTASKELVQNNRKHYVVTKDIAGVIELMHQLDPNNKSFSQYLEDIRRGDYSEAVLDIVDSLIACNWIDEQKKAWIADKGLGGSDAEAIVLASFLLPDVEAVTYISSQKEKMAKLDEDRLETERAKFEKDWAYQDRFTPAKISNLVCVHTTKYSPQRFTGGFAIRTTADANNYALLRNTCHVTLNHRVHGHYGGNWDLTPYTIIAPFESMLQLNGNPYALVELDTWWTRNPGETLKFNNGILVHPGSTSPGEIYEIKEHETIFKGENYNIRDLNEIEELGFSECWEDFQQALIPYEVEADHDSGWDWEKVADTFISKYFPDKTEADYAHSRNIGGPQHQSFGTLFKNAEPQTLIKDRVLQILQEVNLAGAYNHKMNEFSIALKLLAEEISTNIERRLFIRTNELAVRKSIKAMGFPTSEELEGQIGPLARGLGAVTDAAYHLYSPYNLLTHGHYKCVEDATSGDDTKHKIFQWEKYDFPFYVGLIDEKTRRVLYVAGCTSARM